MPVGGKKKGKRYEREEARKYEAEQDTTQHKHKKKAGEGGGALIDGHDPGGSGLEDLPCTVRIRGNRKRVITRRRKKPRTGQRARPRTCAGGGRG